MKALLQQAYDALKSDGAMAQLVAIKALRKAIDAPDPERNFCLRCGERSGGPDHTHTCTPPEPVVTGWNTGLSQDYDKKLGKWFADRPGARQQLIEGLEMSEQNRAAFEAWFRATHHSRLDRNMPDRSYNDPSAYMTWIAWQASRKQALEEAAEIARTTCHYEATEFANGFNQAALDIERAIKGLLK